MAEPEQALSVTESDPNDTEAETERLEDSPQKPRKTQNLVLNNPNFIYEVSGDAPLRIESGKCDFLKIWSRGLTFVVEAESVKGTGQGSDGVSSRASSMENDQRANTLNRPKKRKRSNVDFHYLNDQKPAESIPAHAIRADYLASSPESSPPSNRLEKWSNSGESSHGEDQGSERDPQAVPEAVEVKSKRKLGKASEHQVGQICPSADESYRGLKPPPNGRVPDTNPDDVEMEDSGEYAGSDNINKDEEASESTGCLDSSCRRLC